MRTVQFHSFLMIGISRWLELIEDWVEFGTEVYFIFYEELLENPLGEIIKLMNHFHIPCSRLSLKCLNTRLEGAFHRTSHIHANPFTSDQRRIVDMAIMEADRIIRRHIGRGIPFHLYKDT